jgi:hypothetical protein
MNIIKLLLSFTFGIIVGFVTNDLISASPESHRNTEEVLLQNETPAKVNSAKNQPVKFLDRPQFTVQLGMDNQQVVQPSLTPTLEELNNTYQELQNKYEKSQNRLMELTLEVEALDDSVITEEQMMSLIDDSYTEHRRSYRGVQRDTIYNFHQQEEDIDWGYEMRTKISDFILTHYNANGVNLDAVHCNKISCEVLIKETEQHAWGLIFEDMTKQFWWKFSSSNGTSRSEKDDILLIYLFITK